MARKFLRKVAEFQETDRQASGAWPLFRAHLNLHVVEPVVYHHESSISVYVNINHVKLAKRLLTDARATIVSEALHV